MRVVDGHRIEFDAETSVRMGGIRQKDTTPEMTVRKALSALGLRYRVRNRDLPGSPDIANRAHRWVVFVHGCYWHRHTDCHRATTPKRNAAFWCAKFDANVARDERVIDALRAAGYHVQVVWECQTKDAANLVRLLKPTRQAASRTMRSERLAKRESRSAGSPSGSKRISSIDGPPLRTRKESSRTSA